VLKEPKCAFLFTVKKLVLSPQWADIGKSLAGASAGKPVMANRGSEASPFGPTRFYGVPGVIFEVRADWPVTCKGPFAMLSIFSFFFFFFFELKIITRACLPTHSVAHAWIVPTTLCFRLNFYLFIRSFKNEREGEGIELVLRRCLAEGNNPIDKPQ
jgi:hypothetical protein